MFQNIVEEKQENAEVEEIEKNKIDIDVKEILKKSFTKQNILVYIIAFMLSTVSTSSNGLAPFGLAIFAAGLSNGLPAGIIFIVSLIGTAIRNRRRTSINIHINIPCIYRDGINLQTMVRRRI